MPSGIYPRTLLHSLKISKGSKHKKWTKEQKDNFRKKRIGHKVSLSTRIKMSISKKLKPTNFWKGKSRSDETRDKISETNKRKGIKPKNCKIGHKAWNKDLIGFRAGEKSHLWKGGISFVKYSHKWTNSLKKYIRNRDSNTCNFCNCFGKCVHHIDYNKQNCDEHNLLVLCRKCHSMSNQNRNKWILYFKKIIEVKYKSKD